MINMFKQFFAMLSAFFTAGEKLGQSAVNLSEWAEETTASVRDKAREERKQALIKLESKTAQIEAKEQAKLEN